MAMEGDIIRFPRNFYNHYGIHIGNGKVIHRTGRPGSDIGREGCFTPFSFKGAMAIIRTDDISDVAGAASYLEIANELDSKWDPLPQEEIVNRAKSRLGEKGYSLLFKNCEHFALWCRYDVDESEQAQKLLAMSQGIAVLTVNLTAGAALLKTTDPEPDGREFRGHITNPFNISTPQMPQRSTRNRPVITLSYENQGSEMNSTKAFFPRNCTPSMNCSWMKCGLCGAGPCYFF